MALDAMALDAMALDAVPSMQGDAPRVGMWPVLGAQMMMVNLNAIGTKE